MKFFNFLRPREAAQENRVIALWSLLTAAFYVTALWGAEPNELGVGMAIYLAGVFGLFLWLMQRRGQSLAANGYWIAPALILIASYLLYSNPFAKSANMLVLPPALAVFYGLAQLPTERRFRWSAAFAVTSVARLLSPVTKIFASARVHASLGGPAKQNRSTMMRVVTGVVLMLAVVTVVILPLLASADAGFGSLIDSFLRWFQGLLDATTVAKIIVGALLSLMTVAALLAWGRVPDVSGEEAEEAPLDSIIVGIVLGGVLAVYLVFLLLQAKNLVTGRLPFDFATAVYLVKSGFWQLIALSALNIAIFALAYRRTVPAVQGLLGAFAAASLLLVVSAAHRMGLYVTYYGFSYEKFYACLAVVFCVVMFGFLLMRLARGRQADVLRFAAVLFIWMYAVAAVFPVEQFVWRANVALARLPGSHIRLYELSMLSTDVWGAVSDRLADGTLAANEIARVPNYNLNQDNPSGDNHWRSWLDKKKADVINKHWYHMNLSDVFSMMDVAGR